LWAVAGVDTVRVYWDHPSMLAAQARCRDLDCRLHQETKKVGEKVLGRNGRERAIANILSPFKEQGQGVAERLPECALSLGNF
jgi:hypothetical protein